MSRTKAGGFAIDTASLVKWAEGTDGWEDRHVRNGDVPEAYIRLLNKVDNLNRVLLPFDLDGDQTNTVALIVTQFGRLDKDQVFVEGETDREARSQLMEAGITCVENAPFVTQR
jgi:hypothetical protein